MARTSAPPASMEQEAEYRQLSAALARIAGGDRNALKVVYRDTAAKLFWRLPAYLTRQRRGGRRASGRLPCSLAASRHVRSAPGEPCFVACGHRAEPLNRSTSLWRLCPPHAIH